MVLLTWASSFAAAAFRFAATDGSSCNTSVQAFSGFVWVKCSSKPLGNYLDVAKEGIHKISCLLLEVSLKESQMKNDPDQERFWLVFFSF